MAIDVKRSVFFRGTSAACARFALGFRMLLATLAGLAVPPACSSKTAACDESKCATGQRCVEDECRSSCTVSSERTNCSAGQSCRTWGFADGTQGDYCVVVPGSTELPGADAGGSSNTPVSVPCSLNSDCATGQGVFCVSGSCRLTCSSHFDCQGFGECTNGTDSDGTAGHYCDLSKPQQPGQFYARCPSGSDADCDSANDFFCVGAGAADLEAYCTTDCSRDDDCAVGFACTPLIRNPCNDDCGLTGNAKDRMCVPSEQIGAGQPFQCGSRGVTRNVCRPRKFCTSCTNDSDCLAAPNQICAADQSGAKICTELCDPAHPSCPWGSAAVCGRWDPELGLATCAHRFGKCVGEGKSCEPCEKDADCGANGACNASSFSGEHWCVDFSVTCSCAGNATNGLCTGGGCPITPGGLQMECEDDPASTGSSTGICIGANTVNGFLAAASSPQTGCWPQH